MTLFVDVDDTLVVWDDAKIRGTTNFDERTSTAYHFNQHIVDYMFAYRGNIVIWSGGGQDYAQLWKNRLENHLGYSLPSIIAMAKTLYTIHNVTEDDTVIDDQALLIHKGLFIQAQSFKDE